VEKSDMSCDIANKPVLKWDVMFTIWACSQGNTGLLNSEPCSNITKVTKHNLACNNPSTYLLHS